MDNEDTYEKVAEVLANTIREAAKLAGDDALALADLVEKKGDALVEKAEKTARDLKDTVERMKGKMKAEMKQLAEEIGERSDQIAEEAVAYIHHCSDSRAAILAHHKKLNGAGPVADLSPETAKKIEKEMANALLPGNVVRSDVYRRPPPGEKK